MPLRLDINRRLTARSDRVKSCDLHPTEQWMLVSLYNGNVHIWNHESQQLVKSFEVCDLPVRAAIFVPRKNWVVTGSDDMQVNERVKHEQGKVEADLINPIQDLPVLLSLFIKYPITNLPDTGASV